MTQTFTIPELRLGPVQPLCDLNRNAPPPFDFAKDLGLAPPSALPPSYLNPKLDTGTYWGPSIGGPA